MFAGLLSGSNPAWCRQQQPIHEPQYVGRPAREKVVHHGGEFCWKREHHLRITSLTRRNDLTCRPLCTLRDDGQRIADAKPGILRPMLAFEERIAWTTCTHQAGANGGDDNAILPQLGP